MGLSTHPKAFDEIDASALNNLKSKLESYSSELVFLYKQLHWNKIEESYPIIVSTTVLYLIVWKLSIPLLCLFFLALQCLVLYDYFHTKVLLSSPKSKKDGPKPKEFEELCKVLLVAKKQAQDTMYCYLSTKEENPFWMCALTSTILMCLALLSKLLGDTLFSFVLINSALYYPGLKANGYVHRASVWLFTNVANVLRAFQGKKEKTG